MFLKFYRRPNKKGEKTNLEVSIKNFCQKNAQELKKTERRCHLKKLIINAILFFPTWLFLPLIINFVIRLVFLKFFIPFLPFSLDNLDVFKIIIVLEQLEKAIIKGFFKQISFIILLKKPSKIKDLSLIRNSKRFESTKNSY